LVCFGEKVVWRAGERSRARDEVGERGEADVVREVVGGSVGRVRERAEERADFSGVGEVGGTGADTADGGVDTDGDGSERLVVVGDGGDSNAAPWWLGTARCCDCD
jgi:hypothetical protein